MKKMRKILSWLGVVMIIAYFISMLSNEAGMFFFTPFGAIVIFGYICLLMGLIKQKSWALGILLIVILATAIMTTICIAIIGTENMLGMLASMTSMMSLFILPVFGISSVIRRIIRKYKQKNKSIKTVSR